MQTLAPDSFCPLTDPQPYQRERDKPRQGVVASTLNSQRNGAVGFIDWLGLVILNVHSCYFIIFRIDFLVCEIPRDSRSRHSHDESVVVSPRNRDVVPSRNSYNKLIRAMKPVSTTTQSDRSAIISECPTIADRHQCEPLT